MDGNEGKARILLVDDARLNHEILTDILEEQYEIDHAYDGREALNCLRQFGDRYAVILLDLVMPVMDGYQVLAEMQRMGITVRIPIVIISTEPTTAEKRCLEYGVIDFIHRPFDQDIIRLRVGNAVRLHSYREKLEKTINLQNQELHSQFEQLQHKTEHLHQNVVDLIEILGTAVEARDMETGGHIGRVKHYSAILAHTMAVHCPEYHLSGRDVDIIAQASTLHDIGKLKVSDTILLKPGKLTPEEFAEMKKHPIYGLDLLERIHGIWDDEPEYKKISCEICRSHHERYDGHGYPDGLAGNEIPVSAMIVSLADVYDALTHDRVYKKAFPQEVAYDMILAGECGTFHPRLLEAFAICREEMEGVK